jgi:NAD(P)-dependent dehydrogenase (short-subunit alcohol dehydrogenase family)
MAWLTPFNKPITDWRGRSVWLVGASSGIGLACAHALHAAGAKVCVSARQAELLQAFVDTVIHCAGYYNAQSAAAYDLHSMQTHMAVNYTGALLLLDQVLPLLLAQGHGHVSLVSSVAGFRGLPKSLAYGPSKAALTHLGEVLYLDLKPHGIGVSVVHPGFVATPLTAQNTFHMPALISPEQAAKDMLQGWRDGLFDIHFPKRFTWFLKLLRILPYRWYFPLVRQFTA